MKKYIEYEGERIDAEFAEGLEKSGFSIDSLFKDGAESAAKSFIDIVILTDYMMQEEDYYENIVNLCSGLSKHYERFYRSLVNNIEKQDDRNVPNRASMFLYSM
ncbi:hypothetical protein GF361_03460 [Candidatus Woesearchaeota archaeon]|nr:hypothetical protein [Candidatus Woesearchaeota archaeon]